MQKFKIVRRKPTPCEWEVDQPTLDQWRNEKRLLSDDEIYNYSTNHNLYAWQLYRELAPPKKSNALLIVIIVVSVLLVLGVILLSIGALVSVNVLERLDQSKVEVTKIQMKNIERALEQYRADHGSYPSSEQGLSVLVIQPASGSPSQNSPPNGYLKTLPKDGWGHDFIYHSPGGSGREIELSSLGADGVDGGEGYDADLRYFGEISPANPGGETRP